MGHRRYRQSGVFDSKDMVHCTSTHRPCPKGRTPYSRNGIETYVPVFRFGWLTGDVAGPPFPTFEGVQVAMPVAAPTTPQQTTSPGTPVLANRLPPLGPSEKERYRNMFANTGAQNGLLDGEQARTIFLRARLPNETLGQIWFPPPVLQELTG